MIYLLKEEYIFMANQEVEKPFLLIIFLENLIMILYILILVIPEIKAF
jgi:hypothetical protein